MTATYRSLTGRAVEDHAVMENGTRADDDLPRAVELTRLVVAANESALTGRPVAPVPRV